jgi:hypothetical protein
MTDDFDWQGFVAAAAEIVGITVRPEWRDAVIANFAVAAKHAETVQSFPLPDTPEPAPVYEA